MTEEQLLWRALGGLGTVITALVSALVYKDKQLDRIRAEHEKIILGLLNDFRAVAGKRVRS